MAEISSKKLCNDIRFSVNLIESDMANLREQVRSLKVVNESLRENLNACANADQQRQMLDASRELISVLKIVTEEFKTVCNNCEWPPKEFNSLRIAIEYLERIGAA